MLTEKNNQKNQSKSFVKKEKNNQLTFSPLAIRLFAIIAIILN